MKSQKELDARQKELEVMQFILDRARLYKDHNQHLLAGFCLECYEYGKRVEWDKDRILTSLKANYDNAPVDYFTLIIDIANKVDSFEAMMGKTYDKIIL